MSIQGVKTYEQERVHYNLAKLKKGGMNFEVAINPDLAIAFKNGKAIDIKEIVRGEHIFSDTNKGTLAPENKMKELFGTIVPLEVAAIILKEGDVHLTEEYRKKTREDKLKKIIEIIHRGAVDPKTKLPHPPLRIKNAMEEAKVHINDFKTAEQQISDIVKALRPVLPISFETRKIMIKLLAEHAAKTYSTIAAFCKPQEERWNDDGSYVCTIEIPAGLETDFYDRLNKSTKGSAETKVLK